MSTFIQVFLPIILVVLLLIFFNGLYVGAEFATVASRRTRIRQLAGSGNRMAKMLLPIIEDKKAIDNYVAACQLGITISSLMLSSYGERIVAPAIFGDPPSIAASGLIVLAIFTLLQVILGELLPKSVAIQFPESVSMAVVIPIRISMFILKPLIWFFNGSGTLLLRLFGFSKSDAHATIHSAQEIEILVNDSTEGGLLDSEERNLLRNAFRLSELSARQVMVHRKRMVVAPLSSKPIELLELSVAEGYSRIPLYSNAIDEIDGFVHIKDVFKLHVAGLEDLKPILREVTHVPEALPAMAVWEKLRENGQYVAIVFDEYGGTSGFLTIEDLIEEIFGELQDEFDNEHALVVVTKEGRVVLRGDLLVSDINEYMQTTLPDDDADTVGGLVLNRLGRVPTVGEEVTIGEATLRVDAMDDSSVARISVPMEAITLPEDGEWDVDYV